MLVYGLRARAALGAEKNPSTHAKISKRPVANTKFSTCTTIGIPKEARELMVASSNSRERQKRKSNETNCIIRIDNQLCPGFIFLIDAATMGRAIYAAAGPVSAEPAEPAGPTVIKK